MTPTVIIGVSAFVHDTASCLVDAQSGQVIYALAEERLTNVKHETRFPIGCLRQASDVARSGGYAVTDIAINHDPALFITGTLTSRIRDIGIDANTTNAFVSALVDLHRYSDYYTPSGHGLVNAQIEKLIANLHLPPTDCAKLRRCLSWYFNWAVKYNIVSTHCRRLFPDARVHSVPHHLAHAAGAFFASGFAQATALVMDGQGESVTTSIYSADRSGLSLLSSSGYPCSLGLFYLLCTQYLGFSQGDEYKVMGMAAYGKPSMYELLSSLMKVREDGRLELLENEFFTHNHMVPRTGHSGLHFFAERFSALVPLRDPKAPIEQVQFDFAASLQKLTERIGVDIARAALVMTGQPDLVMSGGVALNGLMNERIRRESGCRELFVYPAAGDDGTAIGAAQHIAMRNGAVPTQTIQACFYGSGSDDQAIRRELLARSIKFTQPDLIHETISEALAQGKIVARFVGRSEFGPRALGHRSILADPRTENMRDILNIRIKHREKFRPFAPACLRERVSELFDLDCDSPFMLLICPVKEKARSLIPAVVHQDGTARVQTVDRCGNPDFYQVIEAFDRLTGIPVVINTSFNVNGEAIVENAADAIESFLFMDIDYLAIGGCWVAKNENSAHALSHLPHDDYLALRRKRFAEQYAEPLADLDLEKFNVAFFNDESVFGLRSIERIEAPYRLGEKVSFAQGGQAAGFQLGGWSDAERWGTWTDGFAASLAIPIGDISDHGIRMTCSVSAFTSHACPQQTAHVVVNGNVVEQWIFNLGEASQLRHATIPARVLSRQKVLRIDFLISDPRSPLELDLSGDSRKLGIGVQDLVLTPLKMA